MKMVVMTLSLLVEVLWDVQVPISLPKDFHPPLYALLRETQRLASMHDFGKLCGVIFTCDSEG